MCIRDSAEGQRIVAFFVLDQVEDVDKQGGGKDPVVKKVPQYLTVLTEPKDGLPFDFNQVRVFTWNTRQMCIRDRVYNAIPEGERAQTAILAGNYGSAGAIDFFGPRYGLPPSISAHQNYYYWGFRQYTGTTLIMLNWNCLLYTSTLSTTSALSTGFVRA